MGAFSGIFGGSGTLFCSKFKVLTKILEKLPRYASKAEIYPGGWDTDFSFIFASILIELYKNQILSEKLKKCALNNQMFSTWAQLEPILGLKCSDFRCVTALYFLSFFYEHPVLII